MRWAIFITWSALNYRTSLRHWNYWLLLTHGDWITWSHVGIYLRLPLVLIMRLFIIKFIDNRFLEVILVQSEEPIWVLLWIWPSSLVWIVVHRISRGATACIFDVLILNSVRISLLSLSKVPQLGSILVDLRRTNLRVFVDAFSRIQ